MYVINLILQFYSRKIFLDYLGTGYVGLSIATLLFQHNRVTAVDATSID